nr:hypothetical protein [Streptomyces alkaliphilus]
MVDGTVVVGDEVAHAFHRAPPNLGVGRGEVVGRPGDGLTDAVKDRLAGESEHLVGVVGFTASCDEPGGGGGEVEKVVKSLPGACVEGLLVG